MLRVLTPTRVSIVYREFRVSSAYCYEYFLEVAS